jgi:hypothetical protein
MVTAGPTERAPTDGQDAALKMILAEYQSLRVEIGRFQDHQQQILSFGFLVFAAVAAGIGSALASSAQLSLDEALRRYHLVLLISPLVYLFLAALFAERTIRILRVGDYLDHEVRSEASSIVARDVLRWEDYRRSPRLFSSPFARALDLSRWLEFVAPIALCIILLILTHPGLTQVEWFLVTLDVGSFIACVGLAVSVDESAGIQPIQPRRWLPGVPRRRSTKSGN